VVAKTTLLVAGRETTLSAKEPVRPDFVAEMTALPTPTAVARPEALTVATEGAVVVQAAEDAKSCFVPSANVPRAANCWVAPATSELVGAEMTSDTKLDGVMVSTPLTSVMA